MYDFIVGDICYFNFQSGLLKRLVIGILENDSVVIDQRISISARRDHKLIRNTFGSCATHSISQLDGVAAAIGTTYRETTKRIHFASAGRVHRVLIVYRAGRWCKVYQVLTGAGLYKACITGPVVKCAGFKIYVRGALGWRWQTAAGYKKCEQ